MILIFCFFYFFIYLFIYFFAIFKDFWILSIWHLYIRDIIIYEPVKLKLFCWMWWRINEEYIFFSNQTSWLLVCVFKTRTHIDIVIFKTLKHFTPYWRRKYSEYEKPYFRSSPRRCSVKKVFLKISQISQKETCGRVSFLIKLHEISKNIFSYETPPDYSLWHFYHKQLFLSNSYKYLTINFNFVLS